MLTRGPENNAAIEIVERAVALNLLDYVRAARTVAPGVQAASAACAGGVAAFMGVASPLTTVKGAGPVLADSDIDQAETFFRRCGVARAVFELAPWISRDTAERLNRRGYEIVDAEDVVIRRSPFEASLPLHRVVPVESAAWPELMLRMNGAPDSPLWRTIVEVCAVLPGAARFGVLDAGGAWIACAQMLPAGQVALFANDATLHSARGRGAQTAAIQERLRAIAARDFLLLAAEVAPGSTSGRNYLRCGFHLSYTRAHYARCLD